MKTKEVKRYMVNAADRLFRISKENFTLDSAYIRILWYLSGIVDMHYQETRDTADWQYDDYELMEFKWTLMRHVDRMIEKELENEEA